MPIYFSEHAVFQLKKRGIHQKLILKAVKNPEEIRPSFRGRQLHRIRIRGKLLEVITKTEELNITIITGYYLKEKL